MAKAVRRKARLWAWILGTSLAGLVILAVLGAVFIPILVTQWLGGDQFRLLASKELSSILKTEGDLQPLKWSSFSVYSAGFASRPGAPGPWSWDLRGIRTEISPRLLLDRILRFSEISIGELILTPASRPPPARAEDFPSKREDQGSSEIFRDVQVGLVRIQSARIKPSTVTGGWGVEDLQVNLRPAKAQTEFELPGGKITTPLSAVGQLQIQSARGRYAPPTLFLTSLTALSSQGATLQAAGEWNPENQQATHGELKWSGWTIPPEFSSWGIAKVRGRVDGKFYLEAIDPDGPRGSGQIQLIDAAFQTDASARSALKGLQSANETFKWLTSQSIGLKTSTFDVLSGLADDPRWGGARLSSANADFRITSDGWQIQNIALESPGFLWARGQIQAKQKSISGRILLGMDPKLGRQIQEFTYGTCFVRAENGYLVEPVELSGTLQSPQNSLTPKITSAAQRRAAEQTARTVGAVLQKISADQPPNSAAGTAGQILNSIFGPPPNR